MFSGFASQAFSLGIQSYSHSMIRVSTQALFVGPASDCRFIGIPLRIHCSVSWSTSIVTPKVTHNTWVNFDVARHPMSELAMVRERRVDRGPIYRSQVPGNRLLF